MRKPKSTFKTIDTGVNLSKKAFKVIDNSAGPSSLLLDGMVNNFAEYKAIRHDYHRQNTTKTTATTQTNKQNSVKVTAASIMRLVRHKMGQITDIELYQAERRDQLE